MDSEKVIARDNNYVLHTYNRNPIVLEKGHGVHAYGPEGQNYLDFTSGIGVNSLGYCDLEWAEAVSRQAHKLQHTSNLYYTAPCSKLAKALCRRTGMNKVFFGNSGAEANEGAIKAARKYSHDRYGDGRSTVITLVNSFHGRTLATLTATGQAGFHQYFGPFNEGFAYAPAGDIDTLTKLVDEHTCAIMLELVQGEGGVVALDPLFVQEVRSLCDEKDLCLIVDEVQTGVGRTGTFLACEQYNLRPACPSAPCWSTTRSPPAWAPAPTALPSGATRWSAPGPTWCWAAWTSGSWPPCGSMAPSCAPGWKSCPTSPRCRAWG